MRTDCVERGIGCGHCESLQPRTRPVEYGKAVAPLVGPVALPHEAVRACVRQRETVPEKARRRPCGARRAEAEVTGDGVGAIAGCLAA